MLTGETIESLYKSKCMVLWHEASKERIWHITQTTFQEMADELNKLLENEPGSYSNLLQHKAYKKLIEMMIKLDKIQEQLNAGESISKQFALFLEKQEKRDSDILREIAILDEKVKQRWGDNYRVEFDIDPECGSGSVKFLVNDSMESIDDFHKKDNYESARNTSIHALVTIDWDKFEQSPQKKTQEKNCETCNYGEKIEKPRYRCNDPDIYYNPSQDGWCTHWQPKQEGR